VSREAHAPFCERPKVQFLRPTLHTFDLWMRPSAAAAEIWRAFAVQSPPLVTYIRVSTSGQGRSGLGIEAQRHALDQFAATEGYEVAREFVEVETGKGSDALDRRPQLRAALAASSATMAAAITSAAAQTTTLKPDFLMVLYATQTVPTVVNPNHRIFTVTGGSVEGPRKVRLGRFQKSRPKAAATAGPRVRHRERGAIPGSFGQPGLPKTLNQHL
jgi:hypothetical protein